MNPKALVMLGLAIAAVSIGSFARADDAIDKPHAPSEIGPVTNHPASQLVVEATIRRAGDFLGVGYGALWEMSGKTLLRVNAADNTVTEIPLAVASGSYRRMAVGEGAVWIPDTGFGRLYKIDPVSGEVLLTIEAAMRDGEASIALGEGSVWLTAVFDKSGWLMRFSAATGKEQARVKLPPAGAGVVAAFGSVWVSGTYKNEIYRIDMASNTLVATIKTSGGNPRFITASEDAVWVINQRDGSIDRIDPSGTIVATLHVGEKGTGGDITSGGGHIYASFLGVPLVDIDPKTNSARRYAGYDFGDGIAYGAGSIWISGGQLSRIAPPT